ncbi:hypothetical protein TREES_T100009505 [Tupaia chinensis]|uniref:Uncharacterized protein n=3 Tax=Tupaia chinensis TaxID=246437 RepID=L8Y6Y7_TUPCH|nr:hypothetical protein TREES_T100009505 [Tupaia chinensis]
MRRRPQSPEDLVDPPPLVVPQRLALRVMSGEAEGLTEAAASIGEPEEPAEGAMAAQDLTELAEQDIVQPAEEVTEEAEVPKECIMYYSEEVTQDKYDNWNDDVEDADGEGEKEEEKKAEEENKENGKEEP